MPPDNFTLAFEPDRAIELCDREFVHAAAAFLVVDPDVTFDLVLTLGVDICFGVIVFGLGEKLSLLVLARGNSVRLLAVTLLCVTFAIDPVWFNS